MFRDRLLHFSDRLGVVSQRGKAYFCPLCERGYRRFLPAGTPPRPAALCPGCQSLERHRLLWLTLNALWKAGSLAGQGKLLHVAPEKCLQQKLQQRFQCVSADWNSPLASLRADVTRLPFLKGIFDAVICNHVLEHIAGDRLALSELRRVLKPTGWACIQVPIDGEITHEDSEVVDPVERLRLYGQEDHVRQYGRDFKDRLEAAKFGVQIFPKSWFLAPDQLARISIDCEDEVWLCTPAG